MASPKSSTGQVVFSKLQLKDSISLRHIRTSSKVVNLSNLCLQQNSSKNMLKNKLLSNPIYETTTHKRTASDNATNYVIHNANNNTEIMHRSLLSKLESISNPDEKIIKMLEFMDDLIKVKSRYSEIFITISETVKEYQKYAKNLDSTRAEHTERKQSKQLQFSNEKLIKPIIKQEKKTLNTSASFIKTKEKNPGNAIKKREFSTTELNNQVDKKKNLSKPKHRIMKTCINIPNIDIPNTNDKGYHQEFMDMYNEFSESWREEIRKLNNNKNISC